MFTKDIRNFWNQFTAVWIAIKERSLPYPSIELLMLRTECLTECFRRCRIIAVFALNLQNPTKPNHRTLDQVSKIQLPIPKEEWFHTLEWISLSTVIQWVFDSWTVRELLTKEYGFVYEIVSWRTQGTMFALKYILEEVVNIWKYVLWDKILFSFGWGDENCPLGD